MVNHSLIQDNINTLVARLAETPRRLESMTNGLDQTRLHSKMGEKEWSPHEILAHLRVCAEVWGKSMLAMISQDHPTLRYASPRSVAKKKNYANQDFQPALQEFVKQRAQLLQALQPLTLEGWSRRATFTGTTRGREQTVYSYAQRLADHEAEHLAQMESSLREINRITPHFAHQNSSPALVEPDNARR